MKVSNVAKGLNLKTPDFFFEITNSGDAIVMKED
jgi:hypothetical protein